MKVLIAGSRGIFDTDQVLEGLQESGLSVQDVGEIVSGGAIGVDTIAEEIAEENGIDFKVFLADWVRYGKRAGMIRNEEMGRYADMLVAIWDGKSKGTKHMIDYMLSLGKEVYVHYVYNV